MFESILITGRGEVAARVERTCRRIGLELGSNELIGGEASRPDIGSVLAAARASGISAIHPGYVAPRVRATMAAMVREAGLVFVGPSAPALEAMADKLAMRAIAANAGQLIVPGSEAPVADIESAARDAERLGYPVFVKPVGGMAGIGIRRVEDEEGLAAAITASAAEAEEAFGDGRLFLERALHRPRQIEVTVVADSEGTVSMFGERECSFQRRHQVLLTEAPSPLLSFSADADALSEALDESVTELARGIGLVGVATFEFLWDADGGVYFLEANSDMQGAILITEMMTGLDPVEIALTVAAGERAPEKALLRSASHAVEVRVCAEDVTKGFAPVRGTFSDLRVPPSPQGKARSEPALEPGEAVPERPEPLVARIATRAPTRHQALLALDRTLAETVVVDLTSNLDFLRRALNDETFRAGHYDTSLAETLLAPPPKS